MRSDRWPRGRRAAGGRLGVLRRTHDRSRTGAHGWSVARTVAPRPQHLRFGKLRQPDQGLDWELQPDLRQRADIWDLLRLRVDHGISGVFVLAQWRPRDRIDPCRHPAFKPE